MPMECDGLIIYFKRSKKRYGFIYIDRTDNDPKQCRRIKKDSFYWYKKVIQSNGENLD